MGSDMVQYLIVGLIVGASAWYAGARYLPAGLRRKLGQQPKAGCGSGSSGGSSGGGSGCDSCNACATTGAAPPAGKRVIPIHPGS